MILFKNLKKLYNGTMQYLNTFKQGLKTSSNQFQNLIPKPKPKSKTKPKNWVPVGGVLKKKRNRNKLDTSIKFKISRKKLETVILF